MQDTFINFGTNRFPYIPSLTQNQTLTTCEIIERVESKCFWRVKAAKSVGYITKDGLQISRVSEIDDGIKHVLDQGHGGLEKEVGRWMWRMRGAGDGYEKWVYVRVRNRNTGGNMMMDCRHDMVMGER